VEEEEEEEEEGDSSARKPPRGLRLGPSRPHAHRQLPRRNSRPAVAV